MAQLSLFEKQRHHSKKDVTISIGKGDIIYITFRRDSWKIFTSTDKISVSVLNDVLHFDNPVMPGVVFTLTQADGGNPETVEHTRYLQINGKAWRSMFEAASHMRGDWSLDDIVRGGKAIKTEKIESIPDEDQEEKAILEAVDELIEEEEVREAPAPVGFIVLHNSENHDRRELIKLDWIASISESYFSQTNIELYHDNIAIKFVVTESFDEVLDKIREAQTPQCQMTPSGLTFWK